MRYKASTKGLPEIGRELGVDAVIEGSIERMGPRIRVRAQLIQAATDAQLWSREYNREAGDLLGLEAEVAGAIAQEIRLQVTPVERARLTRRRKIDPAAQEEYLLGRYHASKLGAQDLNEAVAHFDKATQIQPDFAEAWAGLSGVWRVIQAFGGPSRFEEAKRRAKDAALKAMDLDPDLSEAHGALGATSEDRAGAEREFRKAIELDPNNAVAELSLSTVTVNPESIQHAERAAALDPASAAVQTTVGLLHISARKYDDAERYLGRAIELDPQSPYGYAILSTVYEQKGTLPEALASVEQAARISPYFRVNVAHTYALLGRRKEAYDIIAEAEKRGPKISWQCGLAADYFALGDKDKGFARLNQAVDNHEACVLSSPSLNAVSSDPRFQAVRARMENAQ